MAEVQTQHHLGALQTQDQVRDPLINSLNESLTRYLGLLDQYQTARAALHTNLASGFLHLAQANFKNPNRIHYGQDFYDERMQATVHASIDGITPQVSISQTTDAAAEVATEPEKSAPPKASSENTVSEDKEESSEGAEPAKKVVDPLRWFGILIPQTLRQSQQSFQSAVIEDLEKVVNARFELEELERQIRESRRKMEEHRIET